MRFDFEDYNFKEQANIMNMINNYDTNNKMQNNSSIGFNEDTIYNFIEKNK